MKIIITGSIAFDYLMSFPGRFTEMLVAGQLHSVSLSFLVDSLRRQRGGTAPNIAYTMALLGGHPRIMATAGDDFAGYREWLEDQGIDTSAIVEKKGIATASFFVNTDLDHNQIASFFTGAMAYASELSFRVHAPDADLVVISPNDPTAMQAYVRECKELNLPYVYDPSQQTARLSPEELYEGLNGCYLLTINAYEYCLIQERLGLTAQQVEDRVGGLLVTNGKAGSELLVDGRRWHIPVARPRAVVEPTGAGDAYRAGLLRGLQLGLPWDVSGRMGALAAAYVLEHVGTQGHKFTPLEFVSRYREEFDDEGALDILLQPTEH